MIVVRCIRSIEELNRYGDQYDELIGKFENLSPVYQRGWIERLIDVWTLGKFHGNGSNSLAFLFAERDNKLIGIAPFQIEVRPPWQMNLHKLLWLGAVEGSLGNDQIDFLIPDSKDQQECMSAFVDFLLHKKILRWDLLDLRSCTENSANIQIFSKLMPSAETSEEIDPIVNTVLDGDFDSYFQSMSGNARYQLRRRLRMLQEECTNIKFSESSDIPKDKMDALINIHINRQANVRTSGGERYSLFEDPLESQSFINVLKWTAEEDIARHYWLEVENKLAAFIIGFHSGTTYCYFLVAIDDSLKKYAPGKLLLRFLIENEINQFGTRCINMMSGVNQLKKDFGNKIVGLERVMIQNPDFASRFRLAGCRITNRITQLMKRLAK